eukprot:scaffold19730_cov40-Attheya_sp.AAC.2
MESVPLHQLDTYVTSAVGMKIDTQGVEPEIFMGAERLLTSRAGAPLVIFMEHCSRLRPIPDLLCGVGDCDTHATGQTIRMKQSFLKQPPSFAVT